MTTFCELPPASPAAALVRALVSLGDATVEHGHLLPPGHAEAMFGAVASAVHLLLIREAQSAGLAKEALDAAAKR